MKFADHMKTASFSALAVILFFAATEGLLRLFWNPAATKLDIVHRHLARALKHSPYQADPTVIYKFKPNALLKESGGEVRVNSDGLRGPDIGEKKPGCFRVLALGDSSTYGWAVSEENAYCRQLQSILSERTGKCVEAINAGVPGYSSTQGSRFFGRISTG